MASNSTVSPVRHVSRPLDLEGAGNVRDLGGYPTSSGLVTLPHVFLRADGLSRLTCADVRFLEDYGVTLVVDLRSRQEAERERDPFGEGSAYPEVAYRSVPLLDQVRSSQYQGSLLPSSMAEVYRSLLDDSAVEIGKTMELLADAQGTALFHCSAGKDRTGVVAMLLLKLAGVSDKDVIADYAATQVYMEDRFKVQREELAQRGMNLPDSFFESRPRDMEETLSHLRTAYGDAQRYLLEKAGVTSEAIDRLEGKLEGESR